MFQVGDTVTFMGYRYTVEPIFIPGDTLMIAKVDSEGAYQCLLVDHLGEIIPEDGDTVFAEEIALLVRARVADPAHPKEA